MAKVALLIGVSEYEPGLPCLDAAVRDIEALRRVLQDPEMGGFDEVKKLANPEAHTMQLEIETLFDGRAKDDLVLLFFSGHGVLDADGTLYFASRNTRKNVNGDLIQSTAVETRFVHKIMNNSPAKRQAIILDCCYSGAFDPALQPKDDGSVDLLKQLGSEGRVVLTSSNSTERSFEQQGADLSIYTRYLVEGIETGAGDQNGDGFVSMLELHEYAASKVRETAPKMTPQIVVMKNKGFEIVLAKAKVTDPKLKYRKTASRYANAGTIRPAGRAILDKLRQQLGLTLEEVTEIEAEVLRPYQERLVNLQQYRETLLAEAEHEYPLSEFAREDLITLQQMLGLRDEDILPIQEEVEAHFAHQSEAYQQHLAQYEQALTDAIQREFPFSQEIRQELENLQQSLDLSGDDIARIERPKLEQAELKHQERLRQEVEQQQQEQEKAEYDNNIRRYEQEFQKVLYAEYPLSQHIIDGLKHFQTRLGLKDEDVTRVEEPLLKKAEFRHQEKLKHEARSQQQQEKERGKTEYENKLRELKNQLNELALKDEDVDRVERPIREQAKATKGNVIVSKATDIMSKTTGVDYTELRKFLRDKQWKEADKKTAELMLKVSNCKKINDLDVTLIQNFPTEDLQIINRLWVECSNKQYGFSVLKKEWEKFGCPKKSGKSWYEFGEHVGWYRKTWLGRLGYDYKELVFSPEGSPFSLPCYVWLGDIYSFDGRCGPGWGDWWQLDAPGGRLISLFLHRAFE
jgi:uncharacterized caspase-like protein